MNTESRFVPSFRQLRAFVAVFQLRKLSAAAEQLCITQSAVSLSIRQIEDGLRVRLFDRTTRSLKPTEAALEAIVVAERILHDLNALSSNARDLSSLRRGRVSLAITPTLGEILLPETVRRFHEIYPGVQIAVDDCSPDHFVSRVVGEQVDFGIGAPEQAGADVDVTTLVRDHLSVVLPSSHPLASKKTVRWLDLANLDVITVRPGYGIRPLIDASAAQAGVQLRVVNEVTFLSTALWMTAAGIAVSIMPSAYATHSHIKGLMIKPLVSPRVSRDIMLVTKRGKSLSPTARAFIVELERSIGLIQLQKPAAPGSVARNLASPSILALKVSS